MAKLRPDFPGRLGALIGHDRRGDGRQLVLLPAAIREHPPCRAEQPGDRVVGHVVQAAPGDRERLGDHVPSLLAVRPAVRIAEHAPEVLRIQSLEPFAPLPRSIRRELDDEAERLAELYAESPSLLHSTQREVQGRASRRSSGMDRPHRSQRP